MISHKVEIGKPVLSGNVLLIFKVSSCGGPFWAPVFGPLVLSEKVLLIFEVSSVCLCVCVCVWYSKRTLTTFEKSRAETMIFHMAENWKNQTSTFVNGMTFFH